MSYRVVVPNSVQKQIDDLPDKVAQRVLQKIYLLKDNPRYHGSIKLKGLSDEHRLRIGQYRIRYEIRDEDETVVILHCAHRKDAYRS